MTSTCEICEGTGRDEAFDSPCGPCNGTGITARRFGLVAEHLSGNEGRYSLPTGGNGTGAGRPARTTLTAEDQALVAWAAAQTWSSFAVSVAAQAPRLSEKQLASLRSMKAKCDATAAAKAQASKAATASLPEVPEGRYAVENAEGVLRFYNVDRPTKGRWDGYTFLSVLASDEKHPIKGEAARTILASIAVDPRSASIRYGHEVGRCGRCGRLLTDESSREAGIGPICEAKGW